MAPKQAKRHEAQVVAHYIEAITRITNADYAVLIDSTTHVLAMLHVILPKAEMEEVLEPMVTYMESLVDKYDARVKNTLSRWNAQVEAEADA